MAPSISAGEFEALYRHTAVDVMTFVRRRLQEDAEEIVAETYAVAWRRRQSMPAPIFRRAWLFGIARTLLQAEHRRLQREHRTHSEVARDTLTRPHTQSVPPHEDKHSSHPGLTSHLKDSAREAAITAALDRLTPGQREILTLVAWEGLTPAELAVALGIKPGAARVRLHRARQALAADPQVRALVEHTRPPDHRHLTHAEASSRA